MGTTMSDETTINDQARARLQAPRFVGELVPEQATAGGMTLLASDHGAASASDHISLQALVDAEGVIRDVRYTPLATGLSLLTFDVLAEYIIDASIHMAATVTPRQLTVHLHEQGYEVDADTAGSGDPDRPFYVLVKLAGRWRSMHGGADGESAAPDAAPVSTGGPQTADQLPWDEVGLFERVRRIEAVLDEHIRDALAADGGGMELVDLQGNNLVVQYQGACGSCSSAIGGTMQFIEDTLEAQLGVPLRLDVQGMDGPPESVFGL
jgi:Fe-S cluster biogenesis protein NfuA/NifU-like protein involved in Fe-S cluster formation